MSEQSSPNKDKEIILKYMQLQQELQDAHTQQALGYMTAMTEVIPMVSAGKGLLKSAQAMAKPDVLGMRPTARITNEPRLVADQYEEARRLSDEFLLDETGMTGGYEHFDDALDRHIEDEYIRLADPDPHAPDPYFDFDETQRVIDSNFGPEAFKGDGSLDFDYLKEQHGVTLDKPSKDWSRVEHAMNDYSSLHAALVSASRQDADMLKQTLDRVPEMMARGRWPREASLEYDIAKSMRDQAIARRLKDPNLRAQFDNLPDWQQRSNMYQRYIPEYENVDTFRSDPIDFGQPDFLDTQFEGWVMQDVPPMEHFRGKARELMEQNYDAPVSERDIANLLQRADFSPQIQQMNKNFIRLKELEPEVNAFLQDLEEGMRGLDLSSPPQSQATSKSIGGLTEYFEDEMKDNIQEYFELKGQIESTVGRPLLDVRQVQKEYPELRQTPSYQRDKIEQLTETRRPSQLEMQDYISLGDQEQELFERLSHPEMQARDPKAYYREKYKEVQDKVDAMRQMERYNPNLPGTAPKGVDMSDAFSDYARAKGEAGLMFLPVLGGMYEGMMGAEEEQRIQGELDILREQMTDEERAEAEKRLEEQRPKQTGVQKYR